MRKAFVWKRPKAVSSTPVELQYCRNKNANQKQIRIVHHKWKYFNLLKIIKPFKIWLLLSRTPRLIAGCKKVFLWKRPQNLSFFVGWNTKRRKPFESTTTFPLRLELKKFCCGNLQANSSQKVVKRLCTWFTVFYWFLLRFSQTSCYTFEYLSYGASSKCARNS